MMTGSRLMYQSPTFNTSLFQSEFVKTEKVTNSDLYHHTQQQQRQSSGLDRYSSAPSSFFDGLINGNGNITNDDYFNHGSESKSESVFTLESCNGTVISDSNLPISGSVINHQQINDAYSSPTSDMVYETNPTMVSMNSASASAGGSYSVVGMENHCCNLIRQSSSPAEFFSGFPVTRASNGTYVETSPSNIKLNNQINFSSGPSSCSRFMPQIAENVTEIVETGSHENGNLGNDSWIDSTFTSLKRKRDVNVKPFPNLDSLESEKSNSRNYTRGLTHHLSLPKTSAQMAATENFLQFQQDSIPCKIRAKRGFATHPRSIAERVRRSRISEKIRKLQDLFPNMDKQSNTSDMLDLAVEYIKDLQKQVQTLTDTRAKCTCSSKQK